VRGGERDQRSGHIVGQQYHRDVVAREHLRRGDRRVVGQEAAVPADHHGLGVQLLADGLVGDRLAEPPDVGQRVALADDRSPAARAEHDLGVGVLLRHEQPLEDDVLGDRELPGCVDALDLVGVVDLVAVHPTTGADHPAGEIGQPVLASRSHGREGPEEQAGGGHVSPDVHLMDLVVLGSLVGALDDRRDPAVLAHDPPIGRVRVVDDGGQDRQVRSFEPVAGEQPEQRLRAQQGRVGVGDQHLLGVRQQVPEAQQGSVAGAQGCVLDDVGDLRAQEIADRRVIPGDDDHDARRVHDRADVLDGQLDHRGVAQRPGEQFPRLGIGASSQEDRRPNSARAGGVRAPPG
jgi:hypothetical protein